MSTEICPCGSNLQYVNCCEPILKKKRPAETSLELMRSRYVAFTLANVDYLMDSHHSSTRPLKDKKAIGKWTKSVKWMGLIIVNTSKGQNNDLEGYVEFRALYLEDGIPQQIHENSYFKKENGAWYYVSGDHLKS